MPPVRAKIIREMNYFTAGTDYNLTCLVRGSRPAPVTNMWVGSRPLTLLNTQVRSVTPLGLTKLGGEIFLFGHF